MFSGVSTPASSRKRSSLKPPGSLSTPGQQSQSTPAPPLFHTVTTAKTTVSSSSGAAQKHQLQQTPLALKRLQGTPATIQSLSRSSSGLLLSTAPSSSQQQQQQSFARVLLRTDTCSAAQLVQAEQSTLLLLLAQERGKYHFNFSSFSPAQTFQLYFLGISQKQLRVTLDARSGYALATTSTTTNSSCFVWQYQKVRSQKNQLFNMD